MSSSSFFSRSSFVIHGDEPCCHNPGGSPFSLPLPSLLARPNARRGWWTDAQIQVLLFVRPFPSPLFSDFLTSDLDLRLTLAFGARSKGGQFLIRMTSTHEPTICSSAAVQITEKYTLQKGPFSLPMRLCAKQHSSTISKSSQGNLNEAPAFLDASLTSCSPEMRN